MKEETNLQHVQLPNNMAAEGLDPKDQLIYVIIKSHENKETHEAFPSLASIAKESNMSIPTVRDSIDKLVDKGYLVVERRGRKNVYTFSKYAHFEPFSPEFLNNPNISTLAKSYIVASQQFMFKDSKIGRLEFSNYALSSKINMPESSIRKCDGELQRGGYMTVLKNCVFDPISGAKNDAKLIDLPSIGQAIVGALMEHEDRIKQLEESQRRTQELLERLTKQLSDETFSF